MHFEKAKKMLMGACQLSHPDPSAPLALTMDASDNAVGGVLEQYSNGCWRPLGFWSRHIKEDKQKWTVYRRELLAIQQAIRHFSTEIQGRHLVVFTDHKAIVGSFKTPNAQPHDAIARNKIMEIAQYTSDVRFLEGKANAVADWLSRPPEVPIGTAYNVQKEDEELVDNISAVALSIIDSKTLARDQKAFVWMCRTCLRGTTPSTWWNLGPV